MPKGTVPDIKQVQRNTILPSKFVLQLCSTFAGRDLSATDFHRLNLKLFKIVFFHIQNNSIFTQFKFFLFLMSWHPFVLPRFLPLLLKCAGLSTELKGSWVSITLLKICQRSSLRCYLTNPTPVMEISMPFTSYLDHILDILMYQRM